MHRRKLFIGAAVAVTLLVGGGLAARYKMSRGKSGASAAYGGSLEAKVVPEFTTQDASRWVNGAPTTIAAHRGNPVLIESWSPG
jgi:hypothetical protein